MPGQKDGEEPKSDASFHGRRSSATTARLLTWLRPGCVIIDISDISKPKPIGQLTISPPFGAIPAHDVLPIPGKNLLFVHGEMTGEGDLPNGPLACTGPITTAAMIDIKDPAKPFMISILPRPVPPKARHMQISVIKAADSARTIRI